MDSKRQSSPNLSSATGHRPCIPHGEGLPTSPWVDSSPPMVHSPIIPLIRLKAPSIDNQSTQYGNYSFFFQNNLGDAGYHPPIHNPSFSGYLSAEQVENNTGSSEYLHDMEHFSLSPMTNVCTYIQFCRKYLIYFFSECFDLVYGATSRDTANPIPR